MSSIKAVAELAGVSLSTASIVANGKSRERKISEKTQKKVLDAMEVLNYIPNVSAKTLRKGETQMYIVALFWTFDYRSIMMNRLLLGMQQQITEKNANISVVIHPYYSGKLCQEEKSFRNGEFHAAVIANANMDDLEFLGHHRFQMPIVLYNRFLEGYCSVNLDDEKIGMIAADHLYEQGYRSPGVVHGIQSFPGVTRREEAFVSRMKELGIDLPQDARIDVDNSVEGGYLCGMQVAGREENALDSFFCSSDLIGYGMLHAFCQDGERPCSYGVLSIGNGDPQISKYSNPSMSVINIPITDMGRQCCQFLIERMYTPQKEAERVHFDADLRMRGSTRRRLPSVNSE